MNGQKDARVSKVALTVFEKLKLPLLVTLQWSLRSMVDDLNGALFAKGAILPETNVVNL